MLVRTDFITKTEYFRYDDQEYGWMRFTIRRTTYFRRSDGKHQGCKLVLVLNIPYELSDGNINNGNR